MLVMARKKTTPGPSKQPYPSRLKVQSVNVPIEYVSVLKEMGLEQDRSLAYMVKIALRDWLISKNKLPKK